MARKKPAPRRMRGAPAAAAADPDHPTRRGAVLSPGGPLIGGGENENEVPPSVSGSHISEGPISSSGSPIFPSEPEWVVFRDGTRRSATVEELRRLAAGGPGLGTPEGRARAFVGPLLPGGPVSGGGASLADEFIAWVEGHKEVFRDVPGEVNLFARVMQALVYLSKGGPLLPVYGTRAADVLSELAGRGELLGPSDPRSGNHPAPELCEDEGCPQAGSEHVCVTRVEDIPGLLLRLDMGTVASCTCGVKTPEVGYHGPMCRYRLLVEAAEVIRGFVSRGGASL
jgi:hypothetical protein